MANSFDIALNIIARLPKDLQYSCLFFLRKDEYYAMAKGLTLPFKLRLYYMNCEDELINHEWMQYFILINKLKIPFKFIVVNPTIAISSKLYKLGATYSPKLDEWKCKTRYGRIVTYLSNENNYAICYPIFNRIYKRRWHFSDAYVY